ncbi:MAG: DNA polymerase I [Thermoanaerobaculia bacterium]|nr:DNA polymerase I [Thermoanaerobaculia bacterium]
MAQPARIILVDGTALIYRAYYAIPGSFSTSSGLPTNAIYGFATMFRKMLSGRRPEMAAMVFDPPGPTFRDEKYPEYKAQRSPMPDDLRAQLPWIDKLVEAHNFPLLRVPGFEADDVIGTLTRLALEEGMEVFIVSGDKDFAQLLSDRVRMIDTLRDITYDPELVRKKWGVPPEQFVDLLALMGDKIDNIPGVPGIGQKGASKLLESYGSLDGILENVDELKGRQQKNLHEYRDQALLSRELATIERHVELPLGLDDLRLTPPEPEDLNVVYKELEFYSLLSAEEDADAERVEQADYVLGASVDELDRFLAELPQDRPVAVVPLFDAPSAVTGLLAGLAVATEPGSGRWIPIFGDEGLGDAGIDRLRPWLEDSSRPKVAHNAKLLWIALRRVGVELGGVVGDTLLESYLVDPTKLIPHRLGQIARQYLRRTLPAPKQVLGAGKTLRPFSAVEAEDLVPWACQRADVVVESWPLVRQCLEKEGHLQTFVDVDLPLARLLGAMEADGIAVDRDDLHRVGEEFRSRLGEIEADIFSLAGHEFNVGSPKQLSTVLFEELGLPVIKRTKSGYSTNAEVLQRLAPKHEIARHLLEYRKLAKLINTYTDVLQAAVNPNTGRIHASFQQTVSATGRLISTDPDLQRTPIKTPQGKRIRQSFIARPGCRLISADWSQIELRLLAHFTSDALLVESFSKNVDVHLRTASEIFGCSIDEIAPEQRGIGKLINFSTIYGQGATALAQIVGVPRKEAQRYIDGYFEAYSGVRSWLDRTIEQGHETGYVTTILGRRRYIPELSHNSYMERSAGERMAANTPIQGSAADICKLAMLAIARSLRSAGLGTRLLLQVHDELVFEAPEDEIDSVCEIVRREMENPYPLSIPLVVEVGVGDTWAEAH